MVSCPDLAIPQPCPGSARKTPRAMHFRESPGGQDFRDGFTADLAAAGVSRSRKDTGAGGPSGQASGLGKPMDDLIGSNERIRRSPASLPGCIRDGHSRCRRGDLQHICPLGDLPRTAVSTLADIRNSPVPSVKCSVCLGLLAAPASLSRLLCPGRRPRRPPARPSGHQRWPARSWPPRPPRRPA